jgi:SPP1 gp7 family putative phage head morphogenesis protein
VQPQAINVKSALDSFIDYNSPKLCTFLDHTWKKQQQALSYKQIREAIFAGQLDMGYLAQWQQDYSKFVNQAYAPIAQSAVEASAKALEGIIGPGAKAVTHANMRTFIDELGGKLIREVSEEQYKAVNTLVRQAAMSDTMSARELAKAIRPTIGLTKRQSQSAYNRYMSAIEDGATPAKAREIQAKYAERLHRQRADTIAITELAHAYNNAECMVMEDAYFLGSIGNANKQWCTAFDERVCPACGKMDGETVAILQNFSNGKRVPPAHPRCRCTVNYVDVTQPDLWVQTPAAPKAPPQAAEMTQLEDFKDSPPTGEKLDALYPAQASTTAQELIPLEPEDMVVIPDTISIKGLKYDSPANLGGTGEMHILTDSNGEEWLFKPGQSKGGKPEAFRAHIQEAGYKVQGIVDPDSAVKAGTGTANIPGKGEVFGAAQKRITNIDSSFNLHNWQLNGGPLNADTIAQLQRENVTDWLLCNYDSHGRNFVMTKDGKLIGVDKEQAFRYIGQDSAQKMSLTYHPNKVYGETEPVYNTLYRRFADGEIDIRLNDTLTYIKRIEAIPDKEYREIFRKYAESLHGPGQQAEDLLDKIVYRKQTVRQAYEEFYSELLTKRKGSPATFTFMDATDAFTLTPKNPATASFTPSALNAMTVKDLKAIAKVNGVQNFSIMQKGELISAISDPTNAQAVSVSAKARYENLLEGRRARRTAAVGEQQPHAPGAKLGGLQQLSSALDDIDGALEGSTYRGAQLISDAGALEGMSTTIRKITIDGTEYYELTGKLTNDRWQQALQDLPAQSSRGIYWHYNKAAGHMDYSKPVLELTSTTERFGISTQYIKDGNDIFIIAGNDANDQGRALMGQFNIRIQASSGADAARKMKGFLQRTGMQDIMEEATEEALDRYKKMRVLWQTDPYRASKFDPATTTDQELDDVLKRLGITQKRLDAIKMKKVTDGYHTFYDPENYKIAQQQNAAYLYHEARTYESAKSILQTGELMATTNRFNQGITIRGASTDADMASGGADGVFTRLVFKNQVGKNERYRSFGNYVFVFDPKALERTDWYAYRFDEFGSTKPNKFSARSGTAEHFTQTSGSYSRSNELIFRNTLPTDLLKEVRVPAKERTMLINDLTAAGITQINGKPIAKFIKVVSDLV